MVVISSEIHGKICQFIYNYNGLPIDCCVDLKTEFTDIDTNTLESILAREWQQIIKSNHSRIQAMAGKLLREYELESTKSYGSNEILLNIALRERYSPVSLCRILLNHRYKDYRSRGELTEMLKNPNLIPDSWLAINVSKCLFNDSRDGPLSDIIRQIIGEEYEIRLKEMATAVGMHFYDENALRRLGYDKTPDLKLAIPCMYRGKVINWIESKASFGDMESHQKYLKDQLCSYENRFGHGIVIYWFGYLDKIAELKENDGVVTILDGFPNKSEFIFLTFDKTDEITPSTTPPDAKTPSTTCSNPKITNNTTLPTIPPQKQTLTFNEKLNAISNSSTDNI